jgi:hypothetical protein
MKIALDGASWLPGRSIAVFLPKSSGLKQDLRQDWFAAAEPLSLYLASPLPESIASQFLEVKIALPNFFDGVLLRSGTISAEQHWDQAQPS